MKTIASLGNPVRDLKILDQILEINEIPDLDYLVEKYRTLDNLPKIKGGSQISKEYGISPTRIQQILWKAFRVHSQERGGA